MSILIVVLISTIVVGISFIIGLLAGRISNNKKSLKGELEAVKKELRDYQESANKHLNRTAELISDVYKKCHELQELTLSGSIRLNKDISRQSLLQPATYIHSIKDHDLKMQKYYDEHTKSVMSGSKVQKPEEDLILDKPPKDYV